MLPQGHMGAPLYPYIVHVALRFGDSGSLEEWKQCHNIMFEADITSDCFIHPQQTYIKCLSHWYAVSRAYGCTLILLHRPSCPQIWEVNTIMSCLRLISTSDCFIHPYQTYIKCLSHWYAVSRAYGCSLIPLHRPSCPQIRGFRFT